ncbi:MAG TPA: sugar-binding transcriptional regulator [Firmicutes bacterium]|nr:sugar-binding transcriptional regulator [Bacillota bacterium]
MDRFVSLQRKIAPEIARLLDIRYSILRHVHFYQPIGRRTLSQQLTVKERAVRSELEFLRRQGFVSVSSSGVTLTQDGEVIFQELGQYVRELREFARLEQLLERLLPIRKIVVVAGDSRRDPAVKKDMGRAVVRILREIVEDGDIIAAGGGTTMVEVAKAIVPSGWPKHITVVPTRGSLGEEVEIQADSIAVEMAKLLGGTYRVLNVPDDLHPETISRIINEPRIKEILELIKTARIVIHGVGTLEEMVKRRNIPREEMETLESLGAVAEMFGYYFDKDGNMVYYTPSMGIRPEDLQGKKTISVAGGANKAQALLAVVKRYSREALVIDEAAALKIMEIEDRGKEKWQ